MMKKIFFIHWNEIELKEMTKPLEKAGFRVDHHFDTNKVVDLRDDLPEILVISLERLPSHGRAYAQWMWEAKKRQHIPIVFCGGISEKVTPLRLLFPKAVFCSLDELVSVLEDVKERT